MEEKTKRAFLQEYVLNRTLTNKFGLDGGVVALEAEKAWIKIEEVLSKEEGQCQKQVDQ